MLNGKSYTVAIEVSMISIKHRQSIPLWLGVCFVLLSVPSACARQPRGIQSHSLDPPLVVVAGGIDVRRTAEYDGAVYYQVDDPFPASVLRERLAETLTNAGWVSSKVTLFSLAGPAETGVWGEYQERDGTRITQLFEGWKNASNDLVTFILRYESSPEETRRERVKVTGVLTLASTVEKLRLVRK